MGDVAWRSGRRHGDGDGGNYLDRPPASDRQCTLYVEEAAGVNYRRMLGSVVVSNTFMTVANNACVVSKTTISLS